MFKWKGLPKDAAKAIEIRLHRVGYITYKDVCEMLNLEYNEKINNLLLQLDRGLPWKDFCRLVEKYRNDNKN